MNGSIAVVTGGANGIGKCIVEEFLGAGARVAVIDIDAPALERLQSAIGEALFTFHGDIGDQKALDDFTDQVMDRYGKVDFLVNNACVSAGGLFTPCSYEDFNYVLRIGVTAPFYLAQRFVASFTERGAIVNIASTRASISQRNTESYSAAKGGICALTHALAISLGGKVRVNSISPGWIDTRPPSSHVSVEDRAQHPAGRIGTPEDIAGMTLFLCSEKAGFITGQDIVIDGGMSKQMIYHQDLGWSLNLEGR